MRVAVADDLEASLKMWSASHAPHGTSSAAQATDYYPYGATRIASSTAGVNSSREFIGQFADQTTNLSYLNARYYSPAQGQFLSEDPVFLSIGNGLQPQNLSQPDQWAVLRNPQALNAYSYSQDNPIVLKDPSGSSYVQVGYTQANGTVFGSAGIRIDQYGIVYYYG